MNRTMVFLGIGIGAILLAFLLQIFPIVRGGGRDSLQMSDLAGSAVEYQKKLWTLGYEQQQAIVEMVNTAVPVQGESLSIHAEQPEFTKIVLYQFEGSPWEIHPVQIDKEGNLIYTLPQKGPGYFRELSMGRIVKLLRSSYDR